MNHINLSERLKCSQLVHGYWRLVDWNLSNKELSKFIESVIDSGITTLDHADIYGNYECERLFGQAFSPESSKRKDIQYVTKCGIKLKSVKYPDRKIKTYDYSYDHIVDSVDNSLNHLKTDYIDLLLLHRPSPLLNPEEVAHAFSHLRSSGKVLEFGVSNFDPIQFEQLDAYLEMSLVTNQVEISPYCLDQFETGNLDFLIKRGIPPMAWSPLAGGKLLSPTDEKGERILTALKEVGEEMDAKPDQTILCWLLKHPSRIMPILGSSKIDRIKTSIEADDLEMSDEQWFRIFIASTGKNLP